MRKIKGKKHPTTQYYFVHLTDTFSTKKKKNLQIYTSLAIWCGECIVCVVTRNSLYMYKASVYQYKYNNE